MPINDNTNKYPAQYICVISPVCGVSTVLPAASVTFSTDVPAAYITQLGIFQENIKEMA